MQVFIHKIFLNVKMGTTSYAGVPFLFFPIIVEMVSEYEKSNNKDPERYEGNVINSSCCRYARKKREGVNVC